MRSARHDPNGAMMALAGHALAQPDLQVVSVQPALASLGVGETMNVSVTVRNNGTTVNNVILVAYKTRGTGNKWLMHALSTPTGG